MTRRLTPILLVALAFFGATAADVGACDAPPVPVLAETISSPDPALVPDGMIVVFLPPAGDGFSDGGDGPGGLEWGLGEGLSDGGDVPEGFVAAGARLAGDEFWRLGLVPEGLMPVLAWPAPDGFSDGGDLPEGFIPAFFRLAQEQGRGH
jgi:hypothetical protein